MGAGMAAGIASHPELAGLQDRQLAENVSNVTNFVAERVDALGSRAATINFAKMRLLHLTVFNIRPGHEAEFAEAAKSVAAAYEKVEGSLAWVIYAVHSGAPAPSYLMLTALSSLKDEDAAAARRAPAMEAAGPVVQQRLQEIARSAYDSIETNIYSVNPQLSHMPNDFTALDPNYWITKTAPVSATKSSQ
jgi:heme-degrading monooxygenase HmoA